MSVSRLNLDLLFRVPSVPIFDVSPDSRFLAFSWNKSGSYEIYRVGADGGEPERLTEPPEGKLYPTFSPTRNEILYSRDHQGDELFDLFVMDLESRKTRNITPNTPEAIYPDAQWSPDGNRVAFSSNKSGKFSIYTLPREGGELSQVCDHEFLDYSPEWSPDGRSIAFTSLVKGQNQGVFVTSLESKETAQLGTDRKPLEASDSEWSPDGKKLVFTSAEKGMADIGVYNVTDGIVDWLTDGRYECGNATWSPDGRRVAYECNIDGNLVIKLRDVMHGSDVEKTIQARPGIHSNVEFSPDGEWLYFLYNGPKGPNDLWKYSLTDEKVVQLTKSLPEGLDTSSFVSPIPIHYESSDGRNIPALLYAKDEGGTRPAVVYIHGGPTAQFTNLWHPLVQELVDRGYVVVAPNYRGSTGYGREFREANRFVMGKLDLDDVVKSVDYLVEKGLADPKRIAVTGPSFGGYLTMCALTKYPHLWAAGSALVPFLNWFTEMANEREDLRYWDSQNMGDPEKDKDRLRDASPIFFIDKIVAPVQMIAGAHDPRCPPSETLQAKESLEKLGKKVDIVIYQDEGHGFLKLDNRLDAYKKSVEFLSRFLDAKTKEKPRQIVESRM